MSPLPSSCQAPQERWEWLLSYPLPRLLPCPQNRSTCGADCSLSWWLLGLVHTRCSVQMSSERIRCQIWGLALRNREERLGREEWRCAILLPWRGKGQKALFLDSPEPGSISLSEAILGVRVRRAIVLSSDHATHQPCPFGKSRILLSLGFLPGGLWTRAWVVRSTRKAVRRPHREGKWVVATSSPICWSLGMIPPLGDWSWGAVPVAGPSSLTWMVHPRGSAVPMRRLARLAREGCSESHPKAEGLRDEHLLSDRPCSSCDPPSLTLLFFQMGCGPCPAAFTVCKLALSAH